VAELVCTVTSNYINQRAYYRFMKMHAYQYYCRLVEISSNDSFQNKPVLRRVDDDVKNDLLHLTFIAVDGACRHAFTCMYRPKLIQAYRWQADQVGCSARNMERWSTNGTADNVLYTQKRDKDERLELGL